MAKLPQGTTCETMNQLAAKLDKVLDFYFWKGIPVVRMWPKWRRDRMSPAQIESAAAFASAVKLKSTILPEMRENLIKLTEGSTQTWADLLLVNAMAYNAAGLGYVPAMTDMQVTYGSGIKSITLQFDHPCNPVLQFYRGLRPVSYEKRFRGKTTTCKKPNQLLDAHAYPMTLVFDNMVSVEWHWGGYWKLVSCYPDPYSPCATYLPTKVAQYNAKPETEAGVIASWVGQRLWRSGSVWQGQITGWHGKPYIDCHVDSVWEADIMLSCIPKENLPVGQYGAFEKEDVYSFTTAEAPQLDTYFEYVDEADLIQWVFAPFSAENINGVYMLLKGEVGPVNPGGECTCSFFGWQPIVKADGVYSEEHYGGAEVPENEKLQAEFLHSHYYHMPVYPVCGLPYSSQQAYAYHHADSLSLTIGPKWQYVFNFPRPLKPGIDIYCSFVDKNGELVMMYPVTVTYAREDIGAWGELMADPYE